MVKVPYVSNPIVVLNFFKDFALVLLSHPINYSNCLIQDVRPLKFPGYIYANNYFENVPCSLNQGRIAYASILQIQTTKSGSISSERVCFLLPKAFLLPTATLLFPLHLRSSVNFGTLYIWAAFNKPYFRALTVSMVFAVASSPLDCRFVFCL